VTVSKRGSMHPLDITDPTSFCYIMASKESYSWA